MQKFFKDIRLLLHGSYLYNINLSTVVVKVTSTCLLLWYDGFLISDNGFMEIASLHWGLSYAQLAFYCYISFSTKRCIFSTVAIPPIIRLIPDM